MDTPKNRKGNIPSEEFLRLMETSLETWKRLNSYYVCAMMEIETKFKVLNEEFSLKYDQNPIETIKSRIKEPKSLLEKMQRKKLKLNVKSVEDNIFDMAGVRVICSFRKDIYLLADCLLNQDDITLIAKKDYIKNPKPNGYRGLHLIVEVPIFLQNEKRPMKVEVQLRTIAMDFWASLEHKLRYKKNIDSAIAKELEEDLIYCSETAAELDRKMQKIKDRIS